MLKDIEALIRKVESCAGERVTVCFICFADRRLRKVINNGVIWSMSVPPFKKINFEPIKSYLITNCFVFLTVPCPQISINKTGCVIRPTRRSTHTFPSLFSSSTQHSGPLSPIPGGHKQRDCGRAAGLVGREPHRMESACFPALSTKDIRVADDAVMGGRLIAAEPTGWKVTGVTLVPLFLSPPRLLLQQGIRSHYTAGGAGCLIAQGNWEEQEEMDWWMEGRSDGGDDGWAQTRLHI